MIFIFHISPFLPKFAQTIAYSLMKNTPHGLTFATLGMQLYNGLQILIPTTDGLQIRQDGDVNITNSNITIKGRELELHPGTSIDANFIFQNQ